jgi:hypothetical protein
MTTLFFPFTMINRHRPSESGDGAYIQLACRLFQLTCMNDTARRVTHHNCVSCSHDGSPVLFREPNDLLITVLEPVLACEKSKCTSDKVR